VLYDTGVMLGVTQEEVCATRTDISSLTDRARADDRRSITLAGEQQAALEAAQQACARPRNQGGPAAMNITNWIGATAPPGPVTIRRRPRIGRGRLSACAAVATALLCAGLLAGCGSGSHASSPSKLMAGALAYANCMRSHGVPDFPDPNSLGEFQLRPSVRVENGRPTPVGDLVPGSPALQAAERGCGPFGSAGQRVTAAQEEQAFQTELKAAVCMRANGVPGYPDPKLIDGSIDLEFNGKFDPDSPAFQRAARKCGKPGVPLAGTLPPG
jgi:hypothetical protein